MLYAKGKTIAEQFDVCPSVVRECRRFIAEHPERYGIYGNSGTLISAAAFVDANKIRKIEPELWPPFLPLDAIKLLKGVGFNGDV
ncbi:MAG: hypothetical protein IKE23_10360 [Exiguobacterium sp.]|nr:hypothetical protein [Exiguobacterium sp.]